MSVGVSGANLAVDTEGRLYTVFISPRTVYLPFWYVPLQNRLPFLGELQQRSCSHCLLDTVLAQVSFAILTLWSFFNQHLTVAAPFCSEQFFPWLTRRALLSLVLILSMLRDVQPRPFPSLAICQEWPGITPGFLSIHYVLLTDLTHSCSFI